MYVTIAYAFISWRTLRTIKRQTEIMDRQAKEAKKSANETFTVLKEQTDNLLISAKAATVSAMAADESAKAATDQIQMMKDKERARIWIALEGELNLNQGPFVAPATYVVTQTGPTDAFVDDSFADLIVSETEPDFPTRTGFKSMNIPQRLEPQGEFSTA